MRHAATMVATTKGAFRMSPFWWELLNDLGWAFCLAFFVVLIRLSIDEDRAARGKGRLRPKSFDPNSTQIDNG